MFVSSGLSPLFRRLLTATNPIGDEMISIYLTLGLVRLGSVLVEAGL